MDEARPLPESLVARYREWQERRAPETLDTLAAAAAATQAPKAMIIPTTMRSVYPSKRSSRCLFL